MKHLRVGIDLDAMDRRAGGSVPPPAHVSPAIGEFARLELARVTAAVHALHRQVGTDCLVCDTPYPCRTVLALTPPRMGRAA